VNGDGSARIQKQQAARQGVAFRALDNGFAACENAEALAEICGSLGHDDVQAYFDRLAHSCPFR